MKKGVVFLVLAILIVYPVSAAENNFKFTGKPLDTESSLYYYGARYYNPDIGRFTTPDAKTGDLRNPLSLNRYSYVMNNPLRYVDPSGNDALDVSSEEPSSIPSGSSTAPDGTSSNNEPEVKVIDVRGLSRDEIIAVLVAAGVLTYVGLIASEKAGLPAMTAAERKIHREAVPSHLWTLHAYYGAAAYQIAPGNDPLVGLTFVVATAIGAEAWDAMGNRPTNANKAIAPINWEEALLTFAGGALEFLRQVTGSQDKWEVSYELATRPGLEPEFSDSRMGIIIKDAFDLPFGIGKVDFFPHIIIQNKGGYPTSRLPYQTR